MQNLKNQKMENKTSCELHGHSSHITHHFSFSRSQIFISSIIIIILFYILISYKYELFSTINNLNEENKKTIHYFIDKMASEQAGKKSFFSCRAYRKNDNV